MTYTLAQYRMSDIGGIIFIANSIVEWCHGYGVLLHAGPAHFGCGRDLAGRRVVVLKGEG